MANTAKKLSTYTDTDEAQVLKPRKQAMIKRELDRIQQVAGTLTAEVVLEHATAANHPLHDFFNWDDTAAAHRYRLNQARGLIIAAKIVWTKAVKQLEQGEQIKVRAFPSKGMREGFGNRAAVLDDKDARRHLMRSKLCAIKAAVGGIVDIAELDTLRADVMGAIEKAAATLKIDL